MAEEGGWTVYVPELMDGEGWVFLSFFSFLQGIFWGGSESSRSFFIFWNFILSRVLLQKLKAVCLETATKGSNGERQCFPFAFPPFPGKRRGA